MDAVQDAARTDTAGPLVTVNDGEVRDHLAEVVRSSVEETLNGLLEAEADRLCRAERYERSPDRLDTRAGPRHAGPAQDGRRGLT